MAEAKGDNQCGCKPISCNNRNELCYSYKCTNCKANCLPGCEGCAVICNPDDKCKCCTPICGCPTNCYGKDNKGNCKDNESSKNCQRCKEKCKNSKDGSCICYRCSCGTQCNGFLCACCYFCNPGKCQSKDTCDGFVLGKCGEKCKGHGTYNDCGRPVYVENCTCEPRGMDPKCECHKGARNPICRCIRGEPDGHGNCVSKCDLCGKLCSQDSYIHRGTLVVVPLAVAMIIIIVCSRYRDKFRRVFYELSDSFSRASKHSSASTNNLVSDRIPKEMSTDRYPAFRPMPYAGLA